MLAIEIENYQCKKIYMICQRQLPAHDCPYMHTLSGRDIGDSARNGTGMSKTCSLHLLNEKLTS